MQSNAKRYRTALMNASPLVARIAAELRAAAARKQMSQAAIAAQVDRSQVWISRRLSGQVAVTVEELVLLCGVLEVDPLPLIDHALAEPTAEVSL